jgi:dihydrodipicolinate synthase/N-acetylneuraminate lyase
METLRQQVRAALSGPVCSIPTPFLANDDIDYDTVAKMIDFQIEHGFGMIFLTPGNSQYNVLTDAEMLALGKFCVEYTRKRALVCVTEFGHTTRRMKELATALAAAGADLFLPFPAAWADSVPPENLANYYLECAKIIPLLLIYPAAVSPTAAIGVLDSVLKQTDRVMAVKDDCCNNVSRRMAMQFGERLAIFAGGQKQNFLNILPYGATGYLSTLGMFRPDISRAFYDACRRQDALEVRRIIRDYDIPYFDLLVKQPGGFDAGIHATMEIFGFGTRYRRAPYGNLTDADMEVFRQGLRDLNLLK